MRMRIGKVTNIYPSGKIKVQYEDEGSTSLPLNMLTMNNEYSMPEIGDRVVTMHMENGSSKGFVLGTYYGGGKKPKATKGYRKDFGSGAYAACSEGSYILNAVNLLLSGEGASVDISDGIKVSGASIDVTSYGGAKIKLDNGATIDASNITLKCSYGTIAVQDIMKRLERIENELGLPHTI